jgi:signal transduction protein with GAF and PtsI domain
MSGADDYRLRRIESVTNSALAHLDVEDLLADPLNRVCELLDADTATVLLLDSSSQQLVATAARGIEAAARLGIRIPMGKVSPVASPQRSSRCSLSGLITQTCSI